MNDFLLNDDDLKQIKSGRSISKSFYYAPVFYYMEEEGADWNWYSLQFKASTIPPSLIGFDRQVQAGSILKDAIIHDLLHYLSYPRRATFVIDDMARLDAIRDPLGDLLTRLLVVIGLDTKIDVAKIQLRRSSLEWREEGIHSYNMVKNYFTHLALSPDLYQAQNYAHIKMDTTL